MSATTQTVADWSRLAAFIDGEGCISIARITRKKLRNHCQLTLELHVGNTDPRLAAWILATFKVGHTSVRKNNRTRSSAGKQWKPYYAWDVTGKKAGMILQGCYDFLLLKREQADIAFSFMALIRKRGDKKGVSELEHTQRLFLKEKLSATKSMQVSPAEVIH